MEKLLLEYDKSNHQKLEKFLKDDLKAYQTLFDVVKNNFAEFDGLLSSLEDIINDAPGYLLDQTVKPEDLNFRGLPISRKKALEMVEFPKNFIAIIEAAKVFKASLKNHSIADDNYPALSIEYLQNIENKLSIEAKFLEDTKDDFCVYTRNEKQNKAFKAINIILDQLAVLKNLGIRPNSESDLDALGISVAGVEPKLNRYAITRLRE